MKIKLKMFLVFILTALISLSGIPIGGFTSFAQNEQEEKDPRGISMTGKFINCEEVTPAAADVLINNKGMSGLNSSIHLHNTEEPNSYKTKFSGEGGGIIFAFPKIESLGYMHIWNYNVYGQLDNGMKDVKIQYSIDKENWFYLQDENFRLSKAVQNENDQYGGNAPNNLDDGYRTPINFGGLPVKYVRIVPLTNYGGDAYGLSEVRFFQFKTRPGKGSLIAATARAPLADNAENLTNNYGFNDLTSANALHSNNPDTMWRSNTEQNNSNVIIDLDGNYPLGKMYIWNYNNPDDLGSGMARLRIEYTSREPYSASGDGINYNGGNGWTRLNGPNGGDFDIDIATGEHDMPYSLEVDFNGVNAQHIRIRSINRPGDMSNHGGDSFGLSAIRVFAAENSIEKWAVEPSREWSAMFSSEGSFDYQTSGVNKRNQVGWLQADGIYTLNINGDKRPGSSDDFTRTLFVFSDTLIGNFNNYSGTYGRYGTGIRNRGMQNHTFATLIGNKPDPRNLQFYLNTSENTNSIMGNGDWAQELLRYDDKIYAYSFSTIDWTANQFKLNTFNTTASGFPDFTSRPPQNNVSLIREFTENDRDYRIEFTNAFLDCSEQGGGLPKGEKTEHEGYIYAYGLKSYRQSGWPYLTIKFPIAARVLPSELGDVSKWRFWDGTNWVDDMTKCANIEDDEDGMVSSEYSVTYMEDGVFAGKYVMAFTEFTMSTQLSIATSDTPWGPFSNKSDKKIIYYCPDVISIRETNNDRDIYSYNAKAHPHLSEKDELLISYNLNSMRFDDRVSFEHIYPQFVTLFEMKDNTQTKPLRRIVYNDGENLAANSTITASHGQGTVNVTDRKIETFWDSGVAPNTISETNPVWLNVDFGEKIATNKLVINWGDGHARKDLTGYKLQYSDDGTVWNEVGAVYQYGSRKIYNGQNCYIDNIKFDELQARYFRVNITRANNLSPSIRGINAYNVEIKQAFDATFVPTPVAVDAKGETILNYNALTQMIEQAEQLVETKYTLESWTVVQLRLSEAVQTMQDTSVTQIAIDTAENNLKQSIEALILINLIDLNSKITQADALTPSEYTPGSWAELQAKLSDAKVLYNIDSAVSQSVVDEMTEQLLQALNSLVKITIPKEGWVIENGREFYYRNNIVQRNSWIIHNNNIYRTDNIGAKITGTRWLTIDGKQYRLEADILQTNKFVTVSNKRYYVDRNGARITGTRWLAIGGKQYRLVNDVVQINKFVTVSNKRYYMDKNGVRASGTKWLTVNKNRYRLVKNVVQTNRLITVSGKRYSLNKTGIMQKNAWVRHNKKWYRAAKNGVLITNRTVRINGKNYRFDKNGRCLNR